MHLLSARRARSLAWPSSCCRPR